jgi:hypothetical protein
MRRRWRRSYLSGKVMIPMRRRKSDFLTLVELDSWDDEAGVEVQLEDIGLRWKVPCRVSRKVRARKIKGRRIKVEVEGDDNFFEKLGKQGIFFQFWLGTDYSMFYCS